MQNSAKKILLCVLFALSLASVFFFSYMLQRHNILWAKQRYTVIASVLIIELVLAILTFRKIENLKTPQVIVLSLVYIVLAAGAFGFSHIIHRGMKALNEIQSPIQKNHMVEEQKEVNEVELEDPFTVYISGHDTYGEIDTISRSDVNIVLKVKPAEHKILMINIPRDTYVPIAGGGNNEKDKLTHSGIYGIESSVETIENLFDITIDYYAMVNFTSLEEIVDLIGGIDVENSRTFKSRSGQEFKEGKIHLNGKETLIFSRERYAFTDGDIERGRNQGRVLKAILEKSMSPSNLLKIESYLDIMEKYVKTDMPTERILELVNSQIGKNAKWAVEANELRGEGSMGMPSYAMPAAKLYMYVPYEDSINEIREQLESF